MLDPPLLPAPLLALCSACCWPAAAAAAAGWLATAGAAAEAVVRRLAAAGCCCCCSACCAAGESVRAESRCCCWCWLALLLCRCAAAAWQDTLLLRGAVSLIARDSLRSDMRQGRMLLVLGPCVTFMFAARRHCLCTAAKVAAMVCWCDLQV